MTSLTPEDEALVDEIIEIVRDLMRIRDTTYIEIGNEYSACLGRLDRVDHLMFHEGESGVMDEFNGKRWVALDHERLLRLRTILRAEATLERLSDA